MPINYGKYPSNWKTEIVPKILQRANNRCEICGLENKEVVYSYQLQIKDIDGRYKLKTFWANNYSDCIRIGKFAYQKKIKSVIVVLTIAHLDHDEGNVKIKDDRLKAMCQYCHLNYDSKEKYRRAYLK